MEKSIRHEGIVESIEGEHIRIKIVKHSACSTCKAATHCTASESKEKIVDIFHYKQQGLKIGDAVVVGTSAHSIGKALILGFGLPLVLLLAVMGLLLATGCDEGIAALAAISSLVPYYLGLWMFRKFIADSIQFTIEET